ncbi:MAG: uridine kinase [Pyrinomonadaceae bacterium]
MMNIAEAILSKRSEVPTERAMLVGISGIDGSGKGYITAKIAAELTGPNIAVINVDGWLDLPDVRFDPSNAAENFYANGIRLDEMFRRLVLPLKSDRCVEILMDFAEETANDFRPHTYRYSDIDIILLEGIFLFKEQYADNFDLKIWIECSFETALERAIGRSQEGLSAEETIRAYETIYFPAQRIHFAKDDPRSAADLNFDNDGR